ncbi:Flp pilus assembly protein CpaB [Homoserinimonas sp. A520]
MKTRLIGAILAIALALAGTFVLIAYVRGADARASAGAEMVTVYVVAEEIPAGTAAEDIEKLIAERQLPALAVADGRVTDLTGLAGRVADVALVPGEQLLESRWVDPTTRAARGDVPVPEGMQSLTIALPVEHVVGGTVTAGDTVGIVISSTLKDTAGGTEVSLSKQVFHKVLVTAVQEGTTTRPNKDDSDVPSEPVSAVMVTLARTTPDIETIVWGQEFGSIWLTIEPEGADESGSRSVNGGMVFE